MRRLRVRILPGSPQLTESPRCTVATGAFDFWGLGRTRALSPCRTCWIRPNLWPGPAAMPPPTLRPSGPTSPATTSGCPRGTPSATGNSTRHACAGLTGLSSTSPPIVSTAMWPRAIDHRHPVGAQRSGRPHGLLTYRRAEGPRVPLRQCAQGARREEGRPGGAVPAHGAGTGRGGPRLRPHWRGAQRGLRRPPPAASRTASKTPARSASSPATA